MKKILLGILVVLALSYFAIAPLLSGGFFPIHDNTQVQRVFEMTKALSDGQFPARWVQDLGYGYGYPIFNFYAPLPYYIGGLFNIVGFDSLVATKIMFVIGVLLSAVTMFLFARSFWGLVPALGASVVYMYFPYHAVNIYVRGAVGELYAYAFLPIVFWSLYKLYQLQEKSITLSLPWVILGSIGVFLVIISHNLTGYMLGMMIVFLSPFLIFPSKNKKTIGLPILGVVGFGFLLSSFYSIPALLEMGYTNIASQIGGGADYPDHFVCILQFWESLWGFGGSIKGCVDGLSFRLGKTSIFLVVLSILVYVYSFYRNKNKKQDFIFISAVSLLVVSLFLSTEYSQVVWKMLPGMEYLQYPWRFLNFAGLFISILVGWLLYTVLKLFNTNVQIGLCLLVVGTTLFINVKLFSPQFLDKNPSAYYTKNDRLLFTTSKTSDEYMPRDFKKPKQWSEIPINKVEIVKGQGTVGDVKSTTGDMWAIVNLEKESELRINTAYFPAWRYFVDEKESTPVIKQGIPYFNLSPGIHKIEAKFTQTLVERMANFISAVSIGVLIIGIIRYGKKIR